MLTNKKNPLLQMSLIIISAFIVFYIIWAGASLIIPFVFAVLLSLIIISLNNFFKNTLKLHSVLSWLTSFVFIAVILWWVAQIINSNIGNIIELAPQYQSRVIEILDQALGLFGLQGKFSFNSLVQELDIPKIISAFASGLTALFSSTWIIFFYVLFILLEARFFPGKLNAMIVDNKHRKKVIGILDQIVTDVKSYFMIKTFVSLCTGILSLIILLLFWVEFAVFFAFLIFVFNYIPTIGSIIAVIFPLMFSFVQFESYSYIFFIFAGLVSVQLLMGNIIEPKFLGNKLNLSPLVIILSLGFWGFIWGVAGMLLSVPIMVTLNIIFSKFESTRPLAVLLSEKWEIRTDFEFFHEDSETVISKMKKISWRKK